MDLPRFLTPRGAERKTDIETERSYRSQITDAESGGKLEIIDRHLERARRYLAEIQKQRASERAPQRTPQLQRSFKQAQASDRVAGGAERAELSSAIPAHALFSAGEE